MAPAQTSRDLTAPTNVNLALMPIVPYVPLAQELVLVAQGHSISTLTQQAHHNVFPAQQAALTAPLLDVALVMLPTTTILKALVV